jgi:multicomponent Na+:H+ antiporter subunit G
MSLTETLGAFLLLAGTLFSVLAAWGVVDFPSAIARMHAATKSASLGLALVSLGAGVAAGSWALVGVGALVSIFLFVTAPISGHLLGRAAYHAGQAGELLHDDLAGAEHRPLDIEPLVRRRFSLLRWAGLVAVWMLLWRDVSIGTALGGAVVAGVVEAVHQDLGRRVPIAPVALVRFVARYLGLVVTSNLRVAWEVITPSNEAIREAIVAVPLETRSVRVALVVANAVTYTPGTLTVELAGDPMVLYVHVLHFTTPDEVRGTVHVLEGLVSRALPEEVTA